MWISKQPLLCHCRSQADRLKPTWFSESRTAAATSCPEGTYDNSPSPAAAGFGLLPGNLFRPGGTVEEVEHWVSAVPSGRRSSPTPGPNAEALGYPHDVPPGQITGAFPKGTGPKPESAGGLVALMIQRGLKADQLPQERVVARISIASLLAQQAVEFELRLARHGDHPGRGSDPALTNRGRAMLSKHAAMVWRPACQSASPPRTIASPGSPSIKSWFDIAEFQGCSKLQKGKQTVAPTPWQPA